MLDVGEQLWGFYWKHWNSLPLSVCIANISDTHYDINIAFSGAEIQRKNGNLVCEKIYKLLSLPSR